MRCRIDGNASVKQFVKQLSKYCGFNKEDCKLLLKNEPVNLDAMLADLDLSFDSMLHVLPNSSALLPSLQPLAKRQELLDDNMIVNFNDEPKAGSLKVELLKDEFKPNPHSSKTEKLQVMFCIPALVHEEADYYLKQLNERITYCRENQVNIWKMMHTRETRVEPEAKTSSFFNSMFDSVRESTLAGLVSPAMQRRGTSQTALSRSSGTASLRRGNMAGSDTDLNRSVGRVPDVETRKVELIPIVQPSGNDDESFSPAAGMAAPSHNSPEPRQILKEFAVKAVPRPPPKRASGKMGATPPPPPPPPPQSAKARAQSMIELRGNSKEPGGSISQLINAEIKAAEEAAAATQSSVARTIDLALPDNRS